MTFPPLCDQPMPARRRRDLEHHTHIARLRPGILVLAEVLLRQRVDMRVGALLGHARDLAAHLEVAVRVFGVHDRQRDRRALLHVALLHAALRGVHANDAAGVVEPDRRHLRRAVRHQVARSANAFFCVSRSRYASGIVAMGAPCHVPSGGESAASAPMAQISEGERHGKPIDQLLQRGRQARR